MTLTLYLKPCLLDHLPVLCGNSLVLFLQKGVGTKHEKSSSSGYLLIFRQDDAFFPARVCQMLFPKMTKNTYYDFARISLRNCVLIYQILLKIPNFYQTRTQRKYLYLPSNSKAQFIVFRRNKKFAANWSKFPKLSKTLIKLNCW